MNGFIKFFLTGALTLGLVTPAFAGSVFLVGDNNIFTTQQDNEILFQNVFNGQNVLNASSDSLTGLGTTANVTSGSINNTNLAGQDFLMAGFGQFSYSAAERTSIVDFVNAGGSLFLIGEYNTGFSNLNTSLNQILGDVGSSMRLSLTQNLLGASAFDLDSVTNSTAFGTGVNGWHTDGAQSLLLLGLNGQAVVSGRDPRPCDVNGIPLCDGVGGIGAVVAYEALSAIPLPAAVWLFGTALIGLVGFSKRRKTA